MISATTARNLGIWLPAAFAVVAEAVRHTVLAPYVPPVWISLVAVLVTALMAWLFSDSLFRQVIRAFDEQQRLRSELARMLEQEQRGKALTEALYAIGRDLTSIADLDHNLPDVIQRVRRLLEADMLGLVLRDDQTEELYVKTFVSCSACAEPACFCVLSLADAWLAAPVPQPPAAPPSCGLSSVQIVPIQGRNLNLGVLVVGWSNPVAPASERLAVLGLVADCASLALDNVRLYGAAETMAAMKERQRLARELHDSLAQSMAFLRGRVRDVAELLADGCPREAEQMLDQVGLHAIRAERDVREAIWELKASAAAQGDFLNTLKELLLEFSRFDGVPANLSVPPGASIRLPLRVEVQLVRIVQETLANVRKHARATGIQVKVTVAEGGFTLSLADNGRGFEPAEVEGSRYGLQIMRERAISFGGNLRISSLQNQGACISVEVPFPLVAYAKED